MRKFIPLFLVSALILVLSTSLTFAENIGATSTDTNTGLGENHELKPQNAGGVRPDLKQNTANSADKLKYEQEQFRKKQLELHSQTGSRSAEFKQKATEELKKNFGKLDLHLLAYL